MIEGERMGMVFNMAYGIQGESRYTHIPISLMHPCPYKNEIDYQYYSKHIH